MELLIMVAMLSVCLAAVAALFSSSSRALSRDETADETARGLRLASGILEAEIEQADVASLTPRPTSQDLSFQRVRGEDCIQTLPIPCASPPPTPRMVGVRWRYDESARALMRESEGVSTPIGNGVVSFSVQVSASDETVDPVPQVEYAIAARGPDGVLLRARNTVFPRVHAVGMSP